MRILKAVSAISWVTGVLLCQETADYRVAVRIDEGAGEFYSTSTGQKFIARGNNYIRLAELTKRSGDRTTTHATFVVGQYDPDAAEQVLSQMQDRGYNTVRVFISGCCEGTVGSLSGGINKLYAANLVDFLNRCVNHSVYAIISLDEWLPLGGYQEILARGSNSQAVGVNSFYFTAGGVAAHAAFWRDFVSELNGQGAPKQAILGYTLRNEQYFMADEPPLGLMSGTFRAANGNNYDLSDPRSKRALVDESLVFFIDQVRSAIREVDPKALVGIGFFAPQEPNPWRQGDNRLVRTYPAAATSSADFIDLHPYPSHGLTFDQQMRNFEVGGLFAKPLLMGEFGLDRSSVTTAEAAADLLQAWQVESCAYRFQGWLLWTWDSMMPGSQIYWNALPPGSPVDLALSPLTRPDPCIPGPRQYNNVALNKSAKASHTLDDDHSAMKAVDGDARTLWNSGGSAPQWIEIDLQSTQTVKKFRMTIATTGERETRHRLLAGDASGMKALHEFGGSTVDYTTWEYVPETPLSGIQRVRVETLQHGGWVAWREIELLGVE